MAKRINKIISCIAIGAIAFACNNKKESTASSTVNTTTNANASTATNVSVSTKKAVAENTQTTTGEKGDTLFVTERILVAHNATSAETKKWEKEGGPDFAESLSDNLHYMDETKTNAKKMGLKIVETEKNNIVFVKADGSRDLWIRGKKFDGWGAIGFAPDKKAKEIQIVISDEELKKYFK